MDRERVCLGSWYRFGKISQIDWVENYENKGPAGIIYGDTDCFIWFAFGLDSTIQWGLTQTRQASVHQIRSVLRDRSSPHTTPKEEGEDTPRRRTAQGAIICSPSSD